MQLKKVIEDNVTSMIDGGDTRDHFQFKNSLCKEVWGREKKVLEFAENNDVVIFVAGRNSSNGKSLFKHMKQKNENMFYIEDLEELQDEWILNCENIGISGATSTPQWYMEKVKEEIENRVNSQVTA